VQSAACIRLLLGNWFEPPREGGLHLSTFVQQVLSMIAERGGVTALEISRTLVAHGPFAEIRPPDLSSLLRELGRREMLVQESSGALLLGAVGERIVGNYDFYAAFASRDEWQIVHDGRALGSLPIDSPVFEGLCIIFGGRRWKILSVCTEPAVLTVAPDPTGRPPIFESGRPMAHERTRQEMRQILEDDKDLGFLDTGAQELLSEARKFYRDAHLGDRMILKDGEALLILPWSGDLAQNALLLLLRTLGLERGSNDGLVVRCEGWALDRLSDACSDIVNLDVVDLIAMLEKVENLGQSKWDWVLPRDLLVQSYASMHLDIVGAKGIAARVVAAPEIG
jgi:ATP-dependent Lhr-like helicase